MNQIRKRLTYANVMSSIAVFLVLGTGAAFAALGKNTVGTKQLKKNAVKTAKIGPSAVKTGKLGKEAVKAGKLANGAVLTDKLGDAAVTSGKLANDSVLTDKLANDAVTTDKIANDAVTTGKIANDAVTTGKIANDAVTGEKVKESTLGQVPDAAKLNNIPPSGFLGSNIVVARGSTSVTNGSRGFVNVPCPAGFQVIGGGVRFEDLADGNRINYNGPAFAGQSTALPGNLSSPTAWQASAVNGSGATDNLFVWAVCSRIN